MIKFLILVIFFVGVSFFTIDVFGIEVELLKESDRIIDTRGWLELGTDPLQEQLQIVIDRAGYKNQISVILISTDENDIKLPSELKSKISNPRLISITFTNQYNCAERYEPKNDGCVHISIEREGLGNNVDEIKKNAQEITDGILEQGILGFTPKFHSIIFTSTQGPSSDNETEKTVVTSTYVLKKHSTFKLLNALTPFVLSYEIMDGGGFFTVAEELSKNDFTAFTLSYIPKEQEIVRTLSITLICSNTLKEYTYCLSEDIDGQIKDGQISPLDFIQSENLNRSEKFLGDNFVPLSSVVQVVVISDDDPEVKSVNSGIIKKLENLGDIQEDGWFFMSDSGEVIDGRYIFGAESSVNKNDLVFSLGPNTGDDIKINKGGGGCLIATAAFGSEMTPQIQLLREIRNNTVLQTESGSTFMAGFNQFYYSFSPVVADYERENPIFKEAVKVTLTPLLTSLTLLQYTEINSEYEMLGYGIGIILLNIGMYFVIPALVITKVRKII